MVGGAAPGWYPDPASSSSVRFWDGTQWTGHTAPSPLSPDAQRPDWPYGPSSAPPSPPPIGAGTRWVLVATGIVVVIALFAATAVVVHSAPRRVVGASRAPLASAPGALTYRPPLEASGDPKLLPYSTTVETDPPRASVPTALYSVPSGPDIVTPASARAVTAAIWTLRRRAIALEDGNQLSTFETGSALAVDADRGCGCGHEDRFGAATNTSVGVGHSSDFPAWFYAQTRTTLNDSPWDSLLVFTRTARDKPWRLAFAGGGEPLGGPESLIPVSVGADGYTRPTPAAVLRRADHFAPALAGYWQAAKDGTRPPVDPSWLSSTLTDTWAQHLRLNPQGKVHSNNGLVGYYRYFAAPVAGPFVVLFDDGQYLACASIIGQTTFVAPEGGRVTQPVDRTNWGPDVPPGSYRAITSVDEYTPCFGFTSADSQVVVNGVSPPDEVATVVVP